jgi:outer membrane protein assembly factor BamB
MEVIDDRLLVICDPEPADAEALFQEAKRHQRRRRLRISGIVLLVVVAAVAAAEVGGGGSSLPSRGDTSGSRPLPPVSGARPWSLTAVLKTTLADTPVSLPGTPFAYAITVAPADAIPPLGHLSRIDLATGHMALGPTLPSLSQLFTLGNFLSVLSPTDVAPNGVAIGPWFIRPVIGHGTLLGRAVALPFLKSSRVLAVAQGPTVGHEGVWLGSGSSVYLVNASTGALVRSENLGGVIRSISIDPTGHLLYVVPSPAGIVDELDAETGRVLVQDDLDAGVPSAGVDAVRGGVWFWFRTGNAGAVELLRSSGLKTLPPPQGDSRSMATIPTMDGEAMGGIYPTSVGPTVWLTNFSGISCANPFSGAYLAGTAFHTDGLLFSWSPFTIWNGRVYATAPVTGTASSEIVSVEVPGVCR